MSTDLSPSAPPANGWSGGVDADTEWVRQLARLAVMAAAMLPPSLVAKGPTLCLFRRATGVPCPNCGLARSWTATAHGQLGQGLRHNLMGPPAFALTVVLAIAPRTWLERLRPWAAKLAPFATGLWLLAWFLKLARRAVVG
jgi:uncharacterized protein DUF2752